SSPPRAPRDLHSFPTRRSSDLSACVRLHACAAIGHPDAGAHRTRCRHELAIPPGGRKAVTMHKDGLLRATPQSRGVDPHAIATRSEEHTSELQSRENLVCRLLL